MATFITAKSVGDNLGIYALSSTGYWKYNHDGADSSVKFNGYVSAEITNANGEFTLIPCDADGNESGSLTYLDLNNKQLTSFDGTGLTSLTTLYLGGNQLTSFDGTGLTSLTILYLGGNQLTSLSGFTFPTSLTYLDLGGNQLTSFTGTGLTSLTYLDLSDNQLTSFDGTGLTSLTTLYLVGNQLTSLSGFTFPTSLTYLNLGYNQLTSFDGTGLTSLTILYLVGNQLTSLSGFTFPTSLTDLSLQSNQLTSESLNNFIDILSNNPDLNYIFNKYSFDGLSHDATYPLSFTLESFEVNNIQYLTNIESDGKKDLTINSLNDLIVGPGRYGQISVQNLSDWLDDIMNGINPNILFDNNMTRITNPSGNTFSIIIRNTQSNQIYRYQAGTNGHLKLEMGDLSGDGTFNSIGELGQFTKGTVYVDTFEGISLNTKKKLKTLINKGWFFSPTPPPPTSRRVGVRRRNP